MFGPLTFLVPEKFGPQEIWSLHENHYMAFLCRNQAYWGPQGSSSILNNNTWSCNSETDSSNAHFGTLKPSLIAFSKNCWNELELQNRQLKCTFRHFKAHIFHCRQCCAVWQYLRTMIHIITLQAAPNGVRAFTKLHFHHFHTFERIFSRNILYIHEIYLRSTTKC